jgi:hypothetical protein
VADQTDHAARQRRGDWKVAVGMNLPMSCKACAQDFSAAGVQPKSMHLDLVQIAYTCTLAPHDVADRLLKPSHPAHMTVHLDQIAPWGRSFNEYRLMFKLSEQNLSGGVLDCGGGPASFTAELSASGHRAISVDPIYAYSGSEIRARFEVTAESMLSQVRATPCDWTWSYHRDPDDLLANRRAALESFLADYERGLPDCRYIVGELPSLPLSSGSFRLAVCSHLLFLYSDLLSEDFHIESLRELCRVAQEVRVFPLLTLGHKPSPHLSVVRSALDAEGWTSEVVRVDYELQRGGNRMLRVFRG